MLVDAHQQPVDFTQGEYGLLLALAQNSRRVLDILFLDIDVSIGLNTVIETVMKRVNSRSGWHDANQ